jgi:hypothetical protein
MTRNIRLSLIFKNQLKKNKQINYMQGTYRILTSSD